MADLKVGDVVHLTQALEARVLTDHFLVKKKDENGALRPVKVELDGGMVFQVRTIYEGRADLDLLDGARLPTKSVLHIPLDLLQLTPHKRHPLAK